MSSQINPYQAPENAERHDAAANVLSEAPASFTSARRWGTVATGALVVSILLALASMALNVRIFGAYSGLVVSDDMDDQWAGTIMDQNSGMFTWGFLCRLITGPIVITWMYRAHSNLPALGHASLDSKPVWVIICWFVPFMNLICPYQVMREIWWRSDPGLAAAGDDPAPLRLKVWWGAWLAGIVATHWGNYLDKYYYETASDVAWATAVDLVALAVEIAAAILLIWIIVNVNRRQIARYAALHVAHEPSLPLVNELPDEDR